MPAFQAGDIGPTYDIGISLRSASDSLNCKNRQGVTQALNRVAYMTSTKEGVYMEEATELQRKQQLVQLASSNAIDREFEQWVQATQGDWSDGMLQRVFSGGQNLASRYWDGVGVLWPISDYVPQRAIQNSPVTVTQGADSLIAAAVGPAGTSSQAAQVYYDNTASKNHLLAITNDVLTDTDITAGIPFSATMQDFFWFDGAFWYVTNDTAHGNIYFGFYNSVPALFQAMTGSFQGAYQSSSAGFAGGAPYLAIVQRDASAMPKNLIRLFAIAVTSGVAPNYTSSAFTDLNIDSNLQVIDTCFLGDNLCYTISSSFYQDKSTQVVAFNVASQTYARLAEIAGYAIAFLCPIAGGLFILAYNRQTFASGIAKAELFLLQGNSLQSIGQLPIQIGTTAFSYARDFTRPLAMGPYAIFGCMANDGSNNWFILYAYDVLRGRLFKVSQDQMGANESVNRVGGQKLALGPNTYRTLGGTARLADVLVTRGRGDPAAVGPQPIAQEYGLGIAASASVAAPIRQSFQCVSSIIDFTSSQPKLWRQQVARFDPLANNASVSVTLDVWLDSDPATLAASPQFTASIVGNVAPGATSLVLPLNTVGVKLVYRLTTTGSPTVSAPKVNSVAAQAATGWVWNLYLDLSRAAAKNQGYGYCYESQDSDEVAAYNFLRQLWRQRGGQCFLNLPNGDGYNALIQMESFKSAKPLGVSYRADIPPDRYESVVEIKIREDV